MLDIIQDENLSVQKRQRIRPQYIFNWTLIVTDMVNLFTSLCNDPTIGSYNNYHLSPNGIPRGSQRWYGLVYLVYKNAGSLKGKA